MSDVTRCAWCETELSPENADPIKYARDRNAPNEENMQCRDFAACQQRQDSLDAAQRARMHAIGWPGA